MIVERYFCKPVKTFFIARQIARQNEEARQRTIDDVLSVGVIRESIEGYTSEKMLGRIANMPAYRRRAIVTGLQAQLESYKLSMQIHEEIYQETAGESMKYLAQKQAVQKLEGQILPVYRELFPKAFDKAA